MKERYEATSDIGYKKMEKKGTSSEEKSGLRLMVNSRGGGGGGGGGRRGHFFISERNTHQYQKGEKKRPFLNPCCFYLKAPVAEIDAVGRPTGGKNR